MAQAGTVKSISGMVTARGADGQVRTLAVGDIVFDNEIIETGAGGSIVITLADNKEIALGENAQMLLDETVTASVENEDASISDVEALQAALEAGENIDEIEEETAAGEEDSFEFLASYYSGDDSEGQVGTYLLDADADEGGEDTGDDTGAGNAAPAAADDAVVMDEDGVFSGQLPAASDIDGDDVTYSVGTPPVNGILVINPDGSYTYTPNPNYNGPDSFSYVIDDGNGGTATYTVDITVNPVNDVPILTGDEGAVVEDVVTSIDGQVTIDDIDEGESFFRPSEQTGEYGSFVLDENGNWTYQLNNDAVQFLPEGATLTETFEVVSLDGTATETVTITITGTNDVPVITGESSADVVEDSVVSISGKLDIADVDEGESSFQPTEQDGSYGSFVMDENGNWTYSLDNENGAVQALPAGVTLTETFEVVSFDGTATETVTVTITGTNDVPVITGNAAGDVVEDGTLTASGKLDIADVDTGESLFQPADQEGSYGSFVMDEDGNWTYNLDNENGAVQALPAGVTLTETFEVVSFDGTATETVTVTIIGTNDVPVISGQDSGTMIEDSTLSVNGKLDIADVDTGESSFQPAEQDGSYGSFVMDENGNWTYSLDNENGAVQALPAGVTLTETFEVVSFDGTATETVTVTITGTNDVPVITGNAAGDVVEDGTLTASGKLDIADVDTGESSFQPTEQDGSYGSFVMDENGNWTYSLDNENGAVQALPAGVTLTETFEVVSFDGTATETVTVTITGTNDVPEISGEKKGTVYEDGDVLSTSGKLDIADIDTDESFFRSQEDTSGRYGTFSVDENGNWTYDLDNDAVQYLPEGAKLKETFTVVSLDGTASQKVTVTIVGTNDVPVIGGKDEGSVTEDQGVFFGKLITGGVLTIDDVDLLQDFFKPEAVRGEYGTFTVGPLGVWTYTATNNSAAIQSLPAGETLTEEFTVTSIDGSATHTVTVTITGTNDVPVISGQDSGTVVEDVTLSVDGKLNIADVDTGESLFDPSNQDGDYGSFVMDENGNWTYSLNNSNGTVQALGEGETLTETFEVVSVDGTATETVTVTITGTNDRPEVRDVSKIVFEDGRTIDGQLSVSDVDTTDTHTFALSGDAPDGFILNSDGSWSFDPDHDTYDSLAKGDVLVLKIPYTATDDSGADNAESEQGTITIRVIGTNDRPEVGDVEFGVFEGGARYTGQLDVTDVDEGDQHIFLPASRFPAGFVLLPNGSYSFDPSNPAYNSLREGEELTLTVKYVAVDDSVSLNSISETGTITITVTGTNDRPCVTDVFKTVYEGGNEIGGQLRAYDADNGDTHTFALVGDAPAGFTLNSDGSWSFDPSDPAYDYLAKGETTLIKVPFTATDNSGSDNDTSEEGYITIKVKGTNDAPVAQDDAVEVNEDSQVVIDVLDNDYDVDGDTISIKDYTQPAHGEITLNPDGTFTYTPNGDYNGSDSFTYTIKDENGATSTATVNINVNPVNDAPVLDLEADAAKTTITYDSQSASFNNAVGVYWLDENGDPVDAQIILDGSDNTDFGEIFSMNSEAGNIQFFIIADGASIVDGSTVFSFDADGKLLINGAEPTKPVFYSEDGKNPDGKQFFLITDNGDGTHTIAIEDQTDSDFNDVVLTLTETSSGDGTGYETTYVENSSPVSIASDTVEITDVDDTNIESAVIKLTNPFDGDFLSTGTLPAGISVVSNDGVTIVLEGTATLADYQEAIKAIGFASTSENPATDDRFIEVTVNDGDDDSNTAITTVKVIPVNDEPVAVDDGRPNFSFTGLTGNYYAVDTDDNGLGDDNNSGYLIDNLNEFKHIVNTTDPAASFEATKIWYGYGTGSVSQGNNLERFLNANGENTDGNSLTYNDGEVVNSDEGGFHISGRVYIEAGTYNFRVLADDGYEILINGDSVAKFANNQSPATHVHDSFTIGESGWYDIDMYWWDQGGEYVFKPEISADGGQTYTMLTNEGTYATPEDVAIDFAAADLLDNDFDVDGDDLTIIGVSNAVNGEVTLNPDGSITFTPDADYNGPAQFEYTISDGNGGEDSATVYLVVSPVNDAPVAAADYIETDENTSVEIDVLANDTDADGDALSVSDFDSTSENGGTVELVNGKLVYTPAEGFDGEDTFTYTVSDGNGGTDTETVTVKVNNTNDVPVAQDDIVSIEEGVATTSKTNLVLMLDTSGSMTDYSGTIYVDGEWTTRLALAKQALIDLIGKYGDSLQNVMLVDFDSGASIVEYDGSTWMTGSEAVELLQDNSLMKGGGGTNYDAAINAVKTGYGNPTAADNTYVYFLSDGDPSSNSNGLNNSERDSWRDFLDEKGVTESFAIAVGSDIDDTKELKQVAWTSDDDGNHSGNVITVANEADLSAKLQETVELNKVEGNLLDNDDFGDDGAGSPALVSAEYNGEEIEFGKEIDLGNAGKVTIYSDGRYEFTSGLDVADDASAVIKYVIQDSNGDRSEAELVLTTTDRSEVLAADNADHAIYKEIFHEAVVGEPEKVMNDITLKDGNDTSAEFEVNGGSSGSLSFNYNMSGISDGDSFSYKLEVADGTDYWGNTKWKAVPGTSVTKYSGSGTVTLDNIDPGHYRIVFNTTDNGFMVWNYDLSVTLTNIAIVATVAAFTSIIVENAEGNVLADPNTYLGSDDQWGAVDDMGSEGAVFTVFNGTEYVEPTESGITINGDYGTLLIKEDGSYTYTPESTDGIGKTETFEYKLTQADGDTDSAKLVISIGEEPQHVISGTDGNDTITFDPTADLIDAGDGYDTLVVNTGGTELDFSNISEIVRNVEEIDLTDGDNTLTNLTLQDVLDITDGDNALVIRGNEGDFVTIDNSEGEFSVVDNHLVVNNGGADISFEGGVNFEVTDTHIKVIFTDDGTDM